MADLIITPERVANHNVVKYSFKKVDSNGYVEGEEQVQVVPQNEAVSTEPASEQPQQPPTVEAVPQPTPSQPVPETVVETPVSEEPIPFVPPQAPAPEQPNGGADASELYKKIDEMSSSVIKMEMRLEKQQEEFNEKIEEERERSLAEGMEKGRAEAEQLLEGELKNRLEQLAQSVVKVESAAKNYDEILSNIEKELTTVALDIAKEVIEKEVEENSSEIAVNLAGNLLEDIKEASEITIRVNPSDSDAVKQHLMANPKVKIETDSAISLGGVIIMSNVGNINGDIHKRYEQVRKNTLDSE
ncbi:MAG: flagellar assembly protein FliH [Campylobacterales bacterium]|nr:flagellar assembly protein FliH [Campylobacterales bacterium]